MQAIVGSIGFPAAAAMVRYLRVKLDGSNKLTPAGATEEEIGVAEYRAHAADERIAVVPPRPGEVHWMVAAGPVTQYAKVYGAAGGKVDDTVNDHYIGIAWDGAVADGDEIRVLRLIQAIDIDPLGNIDGNVVIEEDFVGDYPAAGTALPAGGLTKTETDGLGVTSVDAANGILKFAFDAVAEVAVGDLFYENGPVDIDKGPIFEFLLAVYDIGDDASLDIDFGAASDNSSDGDFESIAAFASFHLDGSDLSLKAQSDDGSNDIAAVDSGVDLVDDTFYAFKIDFSNKASVKFYYRALGTSQWTQINSGTTYNMSNYSGTLTPIVMVEKTSNDTTADVRLDRWRVQATRN